MLHLFIDAVFIRFIVFEHVIKGKYIIMFLMLGGVLGK